jgi:hypothetical protein
MGAVTTEQQKLVLNAFAMVLQNNLVTSDVVTWDEYDGEMDDRNGLSVLEQVTPRYNVTRTVNGVKDLSAGTDGTVFGSELFTISGTFNANMGWGDFVKIQSIGDARESKALLGAATSLAEKIDAYVLGKATLASNNWTGTPGNSFRLDDVAAGYTRLKEGGVDDDNLVLHSQLHGQADAWRYQVVKLPGPTMLPTSTYRKGFTGEINGVRTMFTQQLPVLDDRHAIDRYHGDQRRGAERELFGRRQGRHHERPALDAEPYRGRDGSARMPRQGEVFTIPGVFAFDNRKQALVSPARLQQFTVVADAVADGAGNATLIVFPAMIVPGSGAGDDININTAHATVSAAPADNALITFLGAASANLAPRLIIQKQAVVVNTVPLILPASDTSMRRKLSKIPLTVRMWQHSDFNTGVHGVRFDVAMNANIRDRFRMARINGS